MLIDKLLLSVAVQHNGETVKPGDSASQLKAVYEKNCKVCAALSCAVEKNVLKTCCFVNINRPFIGRLNIIPQIAVRYK